MASIKMNVGIIYFEFMRIIRHSHIRQTIQQILFQTDWWIK